jgi:MscS family membrane protein
LHFIATCVIVYVLLRFVLSIVVYVTYKLEQIANKTASQTDNQLLLFFKDFAKVTLIIIGILLILKYGLHQHIGNLLTGLSIAAAAIALATKESLENLIASFIIFFDKPFEVGNEVTVQQVTGTVEKIGLRSTRIRTAQKTYVTVPNKQMVDSIVDNQSLRTSRKITILLHINANTNADVLAQVKNDILSYLQKNESVLTPTVYFLDINKGVLVVQVDYALQSVEYSNFIKSKDETNFMLLQILQKNNLQLSTPQV